MANLIRLAIHVIDWMKTFFSRVNNKSLVLKVVCHLIAAVTAYAMALIGLLGIGVIWGKLDLIAYGIFCRMLDGCKSGYADYFGSEKGGGGYLIEDPFAIVMGVVIFLALLIYFQRKISGVLWGLIKGGVE